MFDLFNLIDRPKNLFHEGRHILDREYVAKQLLCGDAKTTPQTFKEALDLATLGNPTNKSGLNYFHLSCNQKVVELPPEPEKKEEEKKENGDKKDATADGAAES